MKTRTFFPFALCLFFVAIFLCCSSGTDEPTKSKAGSSGIINADNPNIQYVGRFDFTNPRNVVFDWPGVFIYAEFEGTSCAMRLKDGKNFYAITIDGREPFVLKTDTTITIPLASGLSGTAIHTVLIQKRTEAFVGTGEFMGFVLDKGKKLVPPDPRPERRIEYIGNSITCGYGVEGANANCNFSPETENAALSYAALTSIALNADYSMVAYSGRGVVRNYGDANKTSPDPMPSLYDRTCCFNAGLKWNFSGWIPQAVVINLGTNDFSTQPYPDKQVFQNAYIDLISRVENQYPGVKIFCVCGPMIGEPCLGYIQGVVEKRNSEYNDPNVHFIKINQSIMTTADWGCDWHPNKIGQDKIADVIVPVIKNELGW
jgi:hypothetical protein